MSEDPIKMTRADLFDWVRSNDCNVITLPEYKANVIYFENPKTGGRAWLNLPIDQTVVRDFTVFSVCNKLGICIPTQTSYMKFVKESIDAEHKLKRFGNKS